MPSTGFYLFLLTIMHNQQSKIQCVNALNGLLLISSRTIPGILSQVNSVNALNGLLLISSKKRNHGTCIWYGVSMPSTGFYLFLLKSLVNSDDDIMCQCPQRASTYFFEMNGNPLTVQRSVSMPSTGFYLFLPATQKMNGNTIVLCQCPQRASTYFFLRTLKTLICRKMCQCPQRASTYFFGRKDTL